MKFLIDNQLPQALARQLSEEGHDCQHVLDASLAGAADAAIYRYAVSQERVLITKDEDFVYLCNRPGSELRLIWVRIGNCRKAALLANFRRTWPAIEACFAAGDKIVEVR